VTGTLTATGGTITTSGGSTIHTFNAGGTFTVTGMGATPVQKFENTYRQQRS
jgi:hypothetical protein